MKLTFLCATYNEEAEIIDLLSSVEPYVDTTVVVDDGSQDHTADLVAAWQSNHKGKMYLIEHTGLPETVKRIGVEAIDPDSWVLMLDADERLDPVTLKAIRYWVDTNPTQTHMWFPLNEYMDGIHTRTFLKCRLFRQDAVRFSTTVHVDDTFVGEGINLGWIVTHRKTSTKQKIREREYLRMYQKLLDEGKVTQEWVEACKNLHYYVRSLDE